MLARRLALVVLCALVASASLLQSELFATEIVYDSLENGVPPGGGRKINVGMQTGESLQIESGAIITEMQLALTTFGADGSLDYRIHFYDFVGYRTGPGPELWVSPILSSTTREREPIVVDIPVPSIRVRRSFIWTAEGVAESGNGVFLAGIPSGTVGVATGLFEQRRDGQWFGERRDGGAEAGTRFSGVPIPEPQSIALSVVPFVAFLMQSRKRVSTAMSRGRS